MPVRWTTIQGERFLQADRKNRVERARLDLQLKIYEREKLRNWGLAEKERKVLVSNIEIFKRTSGSSNMGVAPRGPKDNSYEKSMYSRSAIRLSEKRLMEWKLCERQLQRFLKQKAVPIDEVLLTDSRPLSTRSAWTEDSKKESAKEKHGGKVDKERAEVQKRVSAFLHGGMKIESEIKPQAKSSGRKLSSAGVSGKRGNVEVAPRQRHHSEVIRPHTANDKTGEVEKPTKQRPASAFEPKKSQFIITKGDVFMNCGYQLLKISGSSPNLPKAQVNNYVHNWSRSNSTLSSASEHDQDVFLDEKLNASRRPSTVNADTERPETDDTEHKTANSDTEDTKSETKSILSDKSSKKLGGKHVSIASYLDELTEEQLEKDLHDDPRSTSRLTGVSDQHPSGQTNTMHSILSPGGNGHLFGVSSNPHSAASSRSSGHQRRSSIYSRHGDSAQIPTVPELDVEDEAVSGTHENTTGRTQRQTDFENPNMYDAYTVGSTVKSAMVFSRSARKKALETLVNINSPDKREQLRLERLRQMKTRSAVLSTIAGMF